jgi:hypothetical protein
LFWGEVVGETLHNLVLRAENRSKRVQFLGKAIGRRWLGYFFLTLRNIAVEISRTEISYGTSDLVGIWI